MDDTAQKHGECSKEPRCYSRSRNKNNNKRKDKTYSNTNHRQIHHHSRKNNTKEQWRRSTYDNHVKIVRNVAQVEVPSPDQFTISQNPHFINLDEPKFQSNLVIQSNPPLKNKTKADQLKDKITPVAKLWASHIKQFLNDSQFVQIYRKGKSLSYGDIQYGRTIVNYDGLDNPSNSQHQKSQSQSKIFSRAYFKLWEILNMGIFKGKQNENVKIACLAQGPGGFINAILDYRLRNRQQKDQIYAITLKISENTRNAKDWSEFRAKAYFEQMRRMGCKISLSYGKTGTGDLLQIQNVNSFAQEDLEGHKCYLVTGDGGIQCISDGEYHYQEIFNSKLFLSQITTALQIQQIGGKFILKIYDCSFELTKQLITLLCIFYKSVKIVKPVTSRPGNSEKYVLCQGFIGLSLQQQNNLKRLLEEWTNIQPNISYFENSKFATNLFNFFNLENYQSITKNIQKANSHFLQQQIIKLQEGFKLIGETQKDQSKIEQLLTSRRYQEQISYAFSWCKKYGLPTIETTLKTKQI